MYEYRAPAKNVQGDLFEYFDESVNEDIEQHTNQRITLSLNLSNMSLCASRI